MFPEVRARSRHAEYDFNEALTTLLSTRPSCGSHCRTKAGMPVGQLNHSAAGYAPPPRRSRSVPAEISLLHGALFLTILISPFVFIEPSPYEAAAAILVLICIIAPVTVDRKLLPLILFLALWIVGGLIALMPVAHKDKTVQFA